MGQVQLGQLAKFTKSAGLETADGVGGEAEAHQAVGEVEGVAGHLGEPVAGQVQLDQVEEAVEGLLVDGGDGAGGGDCGDASCIQQIKLSVGRLTDIFSD